MLLQREGFERECQQRGIKLFVLPSRSPKLNGHVERAQRTHTEEFYEVTEASFEIRELNQALLEWEKVHPSKKDYPTSSSFGISYSTGVS